MATPESSGYTGFIIHAWMKGQDLRICGRTSDGRSFALSLGPRQRRGALDSLVIRTPQTTGEHPWTAFAPPGAPGFRPEDEFLLRMGIRGSVRIEGEARPGRQVDLAFPSPVILPSTNPPVAKWLALDIETGRDGSVRAVSLVPGIGEGIVHLLLPGPEPDGSNSPPIPLPDWIIDHQSEARLLEAVCTDMRRMDPDIVTGWNVAEFDFTVLAKRCSALNVPFLAGRVMDETCQVRVAQSGLSRVTIPGRQVLDAMRVVRSSGERYPDHRLQTVAQAVLGTGKTVELEGEEKLAELDRLWQHHPVEFCAYCREDSRLVLEILAKTGLDRLSLQRAALTGTSLDLAWTSIPTFERIYALELWQRGIDPPGPASMAVSGAAGGTVLDPESGMFDHVWVFDFKSLYPTIMRTFNIDPLAWARALKRPALDTDIIAPNGARFDRQPGILPGLIASYFDQRIKAQAAGDETGAYVYKILMNSFYGVLGSGSCRYGRTALAGAITGFGRHFLLASRDFFVSRGFAVLYGDTDSVFVHARVHDPDQARHLAEQLNAELALTIGETWKCPSWLQIRFEKSYRVFMIPRLRSGATGPSSRGRHQDVDDMEEGEPGMEKVRGRAKGYAGLCEDGHIEVKGMEAARSDYTLLATRFQRELLDLLFHHAPRDRVLAWVGDFVSRLYSGELDQELVYRKMLRRPAMAYTANEPPQVKVARELGWTDRRGRVEYLMTTDGPRALSLCREKPDYRHYVDHQLKPIWESLADAADRGEGLSSLSADSLMAARPLDRDPGQGELF